MTKLTQATSNTTRRMPPLRPEELKKKMETQTNSTNTNMNGRMNSTDAKREAFKKLSQPQRLAVRLRTAIKHLGAKGKFMQKWADPDGLLNGAKEDLATACKLLASVADQLQELPPNFPPRRSKGGTRADRSLAQGTLVCVREKFIGNYGGVVLGGEELEVVAHRKAFVEVRKPGSPASMFMPRAHLELVDDDGADDDDDDLN